MFKKTFVFVIEDKNRKQYSKTFTVEIPLQEGEKIIAQVDPY